MVRVTVSKGTGRKDYGKDIFTATVPVTRSHQYRTVTSLDYDLTPYGIYTIADEGLYGDIWILPTFTDNEDNYLVYSLEVSFDTNVLIKARFMEYNLNTGVEVNKCVKYGYGKVIFEFPKGYFISKESMLSGNMPVIAFLPGGYKMRNTVTYLRETLVPNSYD